MNKLLKITGIAAIAALVVSCTNVQKTANFDVVPRVNNLETTQNNPFVIDSKVKVVYAHEEGKRNAEFLAEYVKKATGLELAIANVYEEGEKVIRLLVDAENVANKEGYKLTVSEKGIDIVGGGEAGVFYGIQTLRKSLPVGKMSSVSVPAVEIKDQPRFAYRGAHFDVARHFYTVDEVKTYIDMMALHNMNVFHWHLTEDQGWRIEIKKYPLLTEIGSKRKETVIGRNSGEYDGKPHGGFYTQEDAKEIVRYAAERHITVVPEIDLPGHMLGALAAYPHLGCTGGPYEVWTMWGVSEDVLCAGNDDTYKFIEDVLAEIVEIFPSEYIHIGGDECPKTRWASCPKCQAKIKALGINGDKTHSKEEYLQSHVIQQAEKFLNSKGRRIIGWDEILEGGLAPNATVMSWRGEGGGIAAAKQHHDVIMTPNTYLYFDYYQSKDTDKEPLAIGGYLPVENVYKYEPMPKSLTEEEQSYIKGVQANLWTEYVPNFEHVQYMVLPRWAAVSEIQWSKAEHKDYKNFLGRLPRLIELYDLEKYNYAKHVFEAKEDVEVNTENGTLDVTLSTLDDSPIYYTLDGTEPTEKSSKYTETIKVDKDVTITYATIKNGVKMPVKSVELKVNKATAKPIVLDEPISNGYRYKGEKTLVDGALGNINYKTGRWLGFQGSNVNATIDLKENTEISSVSVNTCVVKGDWIFDARSMSVSVSEDGVNFKEVALEKYPEMKKEDKDGVFTHTINFEKVSVRYVKVVVESEKSIPEWHPGRGHKGFIFVDEISIN